jgi:hypothetical protein
MIALNPFFTRKFVSVCKRFLDQEDDLGDVLELWFDALYLYTTSRPAQVVRSLAAMARAHILEDLPHAMFELEKATNIQIDEGQYYEVFDHIMDCLRTAEANVAEADSLEANLVSILATQFGLVTSVAGLRVRALRKLAWRAYERRREFAILRRRDRLEPQISI